MDKILTIPVDHIDDVIKVIRAGLSEVEVHQEVLDNLREWRDEEEQYLYSKKIYEAQKDARNRYIKRKQKS